MSVLDEIILHKRGEVARARTERPVGDLVAACRALPVAHDFAGALAPRPPRRVGLIAEVKRASPSKGVLRETLDPAFQARAYADGGASAVSVLTDRKYFRGSLDDLLAVRAAVSVPVLRKEFIVEEYQLWESRAAGADAVLLIVAALEDAALRDLFAAAHGLGLHVLVEAHTAAELDRAVALGARVIGINNRDLHTLQTSLAPSLELLPRVPSDAVAVSERGIFTAADVERVAAAGARAILVGEALVRAADVAATIGALTRGRAA